MKNINVLHRIPSGIALLFVLLLFVTVSCEKAIIDNEKTTEANGNLRVHVVQIEQTPFHTTRADVGDVCTRLNYAIYDMSGARMKQINQTSGDAGFGTCAFQLEEGETYLVVVVGHSAKGNPTMTNPKKIQFTNATGYTDTFISSEEVTIEEKDKDIDVTLHRNVSLCRICITDDIPSEVKKLQFYYTGGSGAFDASTGFGSVASKQTVTFDASAPSATTDDGQKQFDLYTFLHEESDNIALKVTAFDANGNTLYERDFDVPMQQDFITWLTGAFFDGSGSSSSTVTPIQVVTEWAGEIHLTF